MMHQQQVSSSG